MPGKCSFNALWLTHCDYKCWISVFSPNKHRAYCKACGKDFDISAMGEAALKSHMKGLKHVSLLNAKNKSQDLKEFCVSSKLHSSKKVNEDSNPPSTSATSKDSSKIGVFLTGVDTSDAEIKFLGLHMGKEKKYEEVWNVIKMILSLSHGQASVERGFSVNKQIEVENLKEETYISKKLIKDEIKNCHGLKNFPITKELRISVAGARQKYMFHIKQQQQLKELEKGSAKRKHCFEELEELKLKKSRLSETIAELQKSADKLAEKAEERSEIKYITQSNSYRKTAKEKMKELENVEKAIKSHLDELK